MAEERMLNDEILLGLIKANSGGGGGGTTDYSDLSNKPQINGVTLSGDKSASDLSLASTTDLAGKVDKVDGKVLSTNDYTDADKAIVGGVTAALATKQNAEDNNLTTTSKTVVGGINELKSGLTNLDTEVNGDATVYPYADVITIEDAVPSNLADCNVKIEPVQDLHGYDKPWVGGAGRQKLPLVLADIKTANTDGTWNGNVYTINGDTIEVLVDSDNNVLGFKINKTHNVQIWFNIFDNKSYVFDGSYDFVGESVLRNGDIAYTYTFDNTSIDITNPNGVTQVVDDNLNHAHIYIWAAKTFTNQIVTPMVCLSSETDKTFAPYTNYCPITGHTEASVEVTDGDETTKTYTIALGDTIYGGTVDFDSGVMTVTHGKKALNAFSPWGYDQSHHYMFATASDVKTPINNNVKANINSDSYNTETANTIINESVNYGIALSSAGYLIVSDARYTDATTYLTDMGSSELCYELATPTTIQLTPQQIQLLKGQNTLTASTGQISVTVNGVSGSIGALTEEVNDHEERIEVVESKISSYVIVRSYSHLCSLVETNASYEFDIEPDTINGYTALLAVYGANDKTSALLPFITSDATLSVGGKFTLGVRNTTANDIANVNLIYYIVYVKS